MNRRFGVPGAAGLVLVAALGAAPVSAQKAWDPRAYARLLASQRGEARR